MIAKKKAKGEIGMDDMKRTCRDFCEALASSAPTPGGGGAAALCGAVGVALGCMVASLTVGKPAYAAHEAAVSEALKKLDALRQRLLDLAEEDAEGFLPLAKAYRLPKDDPERVAATLGACRAPMAMAQCCCEALDAVAVVAQFGAKSVLSDAVCAAAVLDAALRCAAVNVKVNTREIAEDAEAAALERELDTLLSEYTKTATAIVRDFEEGRL